MLDFDLAATYGIETRVLKQAVRRNLKRFEGDDFMFELTNDEYNNLNVNIRSQFVILENDSGRGKYPKYAPFAFTELGVAMLSSVLNSEKAIDTNRKIMRAFVAVRHLILNPPIDEVKELQNEVKELKQHIEEVFTDYNDINEDTRSELDNINQKLSVANVQFSEIYQALIELADKKKELDKPRNPIGFKRSND
jgi:DNA repair exonuclease SbcCD ATPase subunit